jgi:acetyl-CoA carboxylase carboxyltransferase component
MAGKELLDDSVVTGYGTIGKRLVFWFSQDLTVMSGSMEEMHTKKICDIIDRARKTGSQIKEQTLPRKKLGNLPM